MNTEASFRELYVHPDRNKSENIVKKVEKLGYNAIMLTVDTTILGKRENDMRAKTLSAVRKAYSLRSDQRTDIHLTGRRTPTSLNLGSPAKWGHFTTKTSVGT